MPALQPCILQISGWIDDKSKLDDFIGEIIADRFKMYHL